MTGATPATTLHVGQVLAGRYRIVRQIARGGMSEVYEVEDDLVRERVALKILRRKTAQDRDAAERFRREIQLARRITHPNVCRIFEAGLHENALPFLTMELLGGENLLQVLGRVGRISAKEALPIVQQVCEGIDAAHRAGVVHRDLKASNILLVPEKGRERGFRAVITDFGVARALLPDLDASVLTGTGILVGTPAYMAPEQVEGKPVTEATDVYSLGIVMYEMVTGQLPFTAANPLTTAELRLKKAPIPPRAIVPELDVRWERTILRCLLVRPVDRFASAGEVLRSLLSGPARELHTTEEDATTIDEDSEADLHGPTIPMTADQVALIEEAVKEMQAKRASGSTPKRPASPMPTAAATAPIRPPIGLTIPDREQLPPRPEGPHPGGLGIPPTGAVPTAEVIQRPQEVMFVEASAAQVLDPSSYDAPSDPRFDRARTRPRHSMREKRRLILAIAALAFGFLVAWAALDPWHGSLFGP